MKIISKNKEKGYVGMNFGICLDAVTLWKVGPFRRIIYRDFDGECRNDFGYITWWKK